MIDALRLIGLIIRWKRTCVDQFCTQFNAVVRVQRKDNDRCSPARRPSLDQGPFEAKRTRPALSPGIKKAHDLACVGIIPERFGPLWPLS